MTVHYIMTTGTATRNKSRLTACKALLNMKRARPHKQECYEKESRTVRTFDRSEKTDESRADVDDTQMDFAGVNNRTESICYQATDLPLPQALPPIIGTTTTTTINMNFAIRYPDSSPPAHETSTSNSESEQRSWSPLTSDTSEEMNPPTVLGNSDSGNAWHSTERPRNQMVLVERAPEPLSSIQSLPLRPLPQRPSPLSAAPVLWRPVLIPTGAVVDQVPGVHAPDRYIVVTALNCGRMGNAVLQQALKVIQAPASLQTKPQALQYLKSYFLAVRDRSHVIYVEKDTLV
jgi:hypothetical protein